MEGRHFAVLSSIFLWSLTYLIGFLIISNKFSKGSLFSKITSKIKIFRTIFIATILFPFLAGIFYRVGGQMEGDNPIAWGCYIEDFMMSLFIWLIVGIFLFFVMIYGFINPNKLNFSKRFDVFLTYTIIQIFAFLMVFVYFLFINYFSGELSGKDSSCW